MDSKIAVDWCVGRLWTMWTWKRILVVKLENIRNLNFFLARIILDFNVFWRIIRSIISKMQLVYICNSHVLHCITRFLTRTSSEQTDRWQPKSLGGPKHGTFVTTYTYDEKL